MIAKIKKTNKFCKKINDGKQLHKRLLSWTNPLFSLRWIAAYQTKHSKKRDKYGKKNKQKQKHGNKN